MFLAIASAVASGGGRELLHREHARRLPGQPDHRPPRRAAARAAQHRLAAAGLDAARRHVVRRRAALPAVRPWSASSSGSWPGHRGRPGRRVDAWRRSAAATHGIAIVRVARPWCCSAAAVAAPADRHTLGTLLDAFPTTLARRRPGQRLHRCAGCVVDRGSSWRCIARRRRARRDPGAPRRPPRAARRAAGRDRQLPGPPAAPLAAGRAGAHRPRLGLAGGADAPRPRRPGRSGPASSRWPATWTGRR